MGLSKSDLSEEMAVLQGLAFYCLHYGHLLGLSKGDLNVEVTARPY